MKTRRVKTCSDKPARDTLTPAWLVPLEVDEDAPPPACKAREMISQGINSQYKRRGGKRETLRSRCSILQNIDRLVTRSTADKRVWKTNRPLRMRASADSTFCSTSRK